MNYEHPENCQFSSRFPCIPNNYKMNGPGPWQVMGPSPNQYPSLNNWQGNNGFYTSSYISEENPDTLGAE